jgi:hypothetical protein
VAPAHPSQKEDEEDLAAFELPFFQRLVVHLWAMVLGLITRLTDAVLLVGRPALVRPYVGLWLAERLRSPYRARRSFEVVLALRAPSSRGGAGAGGGEPGLWRDGGGAEEGGHTPFGLSPGCCAGRWPWMCSRA